MMSTETDRPRNRAQAGTGPTNQTQGQHTRVEEAINRQTNRKCSLPRKVKEADFKISAGS